MRIWAGIVIIVAAMVFFFNVSLTGLRQTLPTRISAMTNETLETSLDNTDPEIAQMMQENGGITQENLDLWPGYLESARASGRYSDETIVEFEEALEGLRRTMDRFEAVEGVMTVHYVCLLILLGAAIFIMIGKYVRVASVVAAATGGVLAASLAFYWAGYVALVLALAVVVGGGLGYCSPLMDARARRATS